VRAKCVAVRTTTKMLQLQKQHVSWRLWYIAPQYPQAGILSSISREDSDVHGVFVASLLDELSCTPLMRWALNTQMWKEATVVANMMTHLMILRLPMSSTGIPNTISSLVVMPVCPSSTAAVATAACSTACSSIGRVFCCGVAAL